MRGRPRHAHDWRSHFQKPEKLSSWTLVLHSLRLTNTPQFAADGVHGRANQSPTTAIENSVCAENPDCGRQEGRTLVPTLGTADAMVLVDSFSCRQAAAHARSNYVPIDGGPVGEQHCLSSTGLWRMRSATPWNRSRWNMLMRQLLGRISSADSTFRLPRVVLGVVLLSARYYVGAVLGILLGFSPSGIASIWFPTAGFVDLVSRWLRLVRSTPNTPVVADILGRQPVPLAEVAGLHSTSISSYIGKQGLESIVGAAVSKWTALPTPHAKIDETLVVSLGVSAVSFSGHAPSLSITGSESIASVVTTRRSRDRYH
jgi:hypothetical protein